MKRFNFRLERVKRFQEKQKEASEQLLREELANLKRAEDELDDLIARYDETIPEAGPVIPFSELELDDNYHTLLRKLLEQQRDLISHAKKAVEEARDKYIERAKEVRSLELLRDKRQLEHREDEKRQEKKDLAEHARTVRLVNPGQAGGENDGD